MNIFRQLLTLHIGWKFTAAILLFSSVITLLATATTLTLDYLREVDKIEVQLEQVDASFSKSMALSIWNHNYESARIQINGIMSLPDMQSVEVRSTDDNFKISEGQPQANAPLSREFSLSYAPWGEPQKIGVLRISATLDGVYQRLKDQLIAILFTQIIKTFVVSFFILYLFYRLVGRHLTRLSRSLKNINFDAKSGEVEMLTLDRKPAADMHKDELDQMVTSINMMARRLTAAYQDIQASEMKFRGVIEAAPEAMIIINDKNVITLANKETSTLFGYAKEELVGQPVNILLPEEYRQKHVTHVGNFFKNTPQQRRMGGERNLFGLRKDGTKIPVEIGLSPIQTGGEQFVIATIVDLSERIAKEKEIMAMHEQLAQASKMESVGHLTAGIAHDFNNMLAAIMGYAALSQYMLKTGNTAAIERYQDEVLNAGGRAKELIAQMLNFSRLSPEIEGEEVPVTLLATIMKEVVNLLRSSIPSTIELNVQLETEGLQARIPPVHLHQILLNLGVNARDAIGEYGTIGISLHKLHADNQVCASCKTTFAGDYAQISVKDSGSGIPADILNKIFDPFFTTKGLGKGTGMGLSVVHGLVHAIGGHIQIQSSADTGTTFNILLPLAKADSAVQATEKSAPLENIAGTRIMVVDDENVIAVMLDEFLSAQGAHVTIFNDPIPALEYYIKNSSGIDLVISDETMPHMSGMHFSEKLLNINPRLPIILCTGYSEHASAEACAKIGISALFIKPIDLNQLIQRIYTLRPQRPA